MAEDKIRVKDLLGEFGTTSKDMLRALRELGLPAKSCAGSVTPEDAERLRDHFASRKAEAVDRPSANVIVRRRRHKDEAEPPAAQSGAEPAEDAEEASSGPAEAVAGGSEAAAAADAGESEGGSATPAGNAGESAANANKGGERAEGRQRRPRESREERDLREKVRNVGARVISRPGDISADEVRAAKEALEKISHKKKPERQGKTLAQEIREREEQKARELAEQAERERAEAAAKAGADKPRAEKRAAAAILAQPARIVAKPSRQEEEAALPVDGPAAGEAAEAAPAPEKQGKSARAEARQGGVSPVLEAIREPAPKARLANASAAPTGSSAPTLPPRASEEAREAPVHKVRVISRPAPGAAPAAPRRAPAPRQDGQRPRPGGPRPGAPRAAFAQPMQPPMPGAAEGRDGQSKKKRLKGRRTVDFQQGDFGHHGDDDEVMRTSRGKRRKTQKPMAQTQTTQPIKAAKRKIRVAEAIRVADMAHQMGLKANEIIKELFRLGVMATINQSLDIDTATLVAAAFDYEVEKAGFSEEDFLSAQKEADTPESLKPRPPVVTIMGHVDHGKTSLLDAIRKSNVTSGEAGGITQHIGAYHVRTKRGEIVFLDTPGHEAFTAMRARGAQITDLVILVVAADDGVMEQTREAINHSRAAGVPIMVAVNKIDKPGADPDRVLRELAELGLQPEDWGGETIVARVSAKTRDGLDDLLELVALQSEIMELKANPDKAARGHIVEARLDKGRGAVATVLIQEGTLRMGDNFVCGPYFGRVRALTSDQGRKVKEAGPSLPVEVQGFEGVPEAGEEFTVVADDKLARRIADSRAIKRRERDLASEARVTLETFLAHAGEHETPTLNLVLKADVQGSLEAITEALNKLSTDKVKIHIVHGGTGAISESDIMLASASRAIILGFNVRPTARIKDIAEKENVDIRYYDIIYKMADDIKNAMAGLLAPVKREVYLGQAEVRKVYHLPKAGSIAGSFVSDGKVARNAGARILRDGVVAYTGRIASLRRLKDDVREVVKGNECGIGLENFNDIKEGDLLEVFETVEEAATL